MAKSVCLATRLSSVMELLTAAAVKQICEMVDGDVVSLRLELAQAQSQNAALIEEVGALLVEVRQLRDAKTATTKTQRSVYVQTQEDPPSINRIYGKEWCSGLWNRSDADTKDTAINVDSVVTDEPENHDHSKLLPIKEEKLEKDVCPDDTNKNTPPSRRKEPLKTSNVIEVNLVDKDDDDLYFVSAGFSKTPDIGTVTPGSQCTDSTKFISPDGTVEQVIMPSGEQLLYNEHCMPVEFFEDPQFEDEASNGTQNMFMDFQNVPSTDSGHIFNYLNQFNEHYHFEPQEQFSKTKYSCSECNRTFIRESSLVLHAQKCHQRLNTHRCQNCKIVFPQKNLLRTHKCLPPEKLSSCLKFSCEQCGKQFHSRANLKVHYAVHTGEKPHRCSYCGKGFSQKGNLNTHERIHKGERPFVCVTCGKAFTQKINLSQHLGVHTRIRKSRMRKHMERIL